MRPRLCGAPSTSEGGRAMQSRTDLGNTPASVDYGDNAVSLRERIMQGKIPDRRTMERMLYNIGRHVEGREFKTKEEFDRFLKQSDGVKKVVPSAPPRNALEEAQNVMYDAWDAEDADERVRLARKALEISHDCADAYVLLAEEVAENTWEAHDLYRNGVAAGERALGEQFLKENIGHFWGILETRPYMRAREGMADALMNLGRHEEAIGHYKEMLRLNPGDNQGIRYVMARHLAALGRYDELEALFSRHFAGELSADSIYTKVLLSFVQDGPTEKTGKLLTSAIAYNPHVFAYLTGVRPMPDEPPEAISPGSEDEAAAYMHDFSPAWLRVPAALEWLSLEMESRGAFAGPRKLSSSRGPDRNAPCPCGSGKKYKKCCGRKS